MDAWDLSSGESQVVGYYVLGDTRTVHQWTPIEFWGYQLTQPGTYTITAVSDLTAWSITGHGAEYIRGLIPIQSNSLKIQILR